MPANPYYNGKAARNPTLGEHLAARAALAALKVPLVPDENLVTAPNLAPDPGIDAGSSPKAQENPEQKEDQPSFQNPAVARCNDAYSAAFAVGFDTGVPFYERNKNANEAYRLVMPALSGRQNISDFVACVAQGMLLDVFEDGDGTRLLYAAQVAYSTTSAPLSAPNPPLPDRRKHRKTSNIAS